MRHGLLSLVFLSFLALPPVQAETDPLVSLFNFQLRMAEGGNVKAMMKVGRMYENGEGTPRDYAKALEMYRRAQALGDPGAAAAIRRVEAKRRGKPARAKPPARKQAAQPASRVATQPAKARQEAARKAAQEKARREAAARKAAQEKARREAAARRAAQEKARREAAARKAAQEKARREAAARKAAQEKARREAAARRAAQEKADRIASANTASPTADRAPETRAAPAADAAERETKTFSSDPCKTRAARFLSSCKKK